MASSDRGSIDVTYSPSFESIIKPPVAALSDHGAFFMSCVRRNGTSGKLVNSLLQEYDHEILEDRLSRRNGKNRKWKASDKLRIVLAAMQPGVEVSEVC